MSRLSKPAPGPLELMLGVFWPWKSELAKALPPMAVPARAAIDSARGIKNERFFKANTPLLSRLVDLEVTCWASWR
jgi:hypothetical protein